MTTEGQSEEISIAGWEKWVLSLDKYIDPNDQPKKRRYALMAGAVLCTACYLLLSILILNNDALILVAAAFFIEPVLSAFDSAGWRTDRYFKYLGEKNEREKNLTIVERYNKKSSSSSYCDPKNLRPFPEKGWLKSRLLEHYICTVYEIRSSAFVGWLIASVILAIPVLLFNLLTK